MPSIEQRDAAGDEDRLEDLLTTIPLLRSSTQDLPSTSSRPSVTPGDVTLFTHKPNVHIVRPLPRQVPPQRDESLAALEAQIQRVAGRHDTSTGGSAELKKNPLPSSGVVVVVPKRKLIPMDPVLHKPLFITTVPSGVFLEKSQDTVDCPRKVYNYSSAPRVLQSGGAGEKRSNGLTKDSASCLSSKKSNIYGSRRDIR